MAKRREIPRLRRPILRLRSGQAIRFANGGRNLPASPGMTGVGPARVGPEGPTPERRAKAASSRRTPKQRWRHKVAATNQGHDASCPYKRRRSSSRFLAALGMTWHIRRAASEDDEAKRDSSTAQADPSASLRTGHSLREWRKKSACSARSRKTIRDAKGANDGGGAGACQGSRSESGQVPLRPPKAQGVSLRRAWRYGIESVHGQAGRIQAETAVRPDAGAVGGARRCRG
jgi:hypothetical protein